MTQIDGGLYLYLDGEKCGESHPKLAEFFRHNIMVAKAELRGVLQGRAESNVRDDIDRWRWYLERNGYDPNQPPSGRRPQPTPSGAVHGSNPRLPASNERPETE